MHCRAIFAIVAKLTCAVSQVRLPQRWKPIWNDGPSFGRPIFLRDKIGDSDGVVVCFFSFLFFFWGGGEEKAAKSMDHLRTGPRKRWKMVPWWWFAFCYGFWLWDPDKKMASFYGFENGGDPNHVSKSWDDPPSKTSEPHRILNFVARW